VRALYDQGRVSKNWWETYRVRQIEATKAPHDKLLELHIPAKIGSIKTAKKKSAAIA
jgi:hypothetical protein